MSENKYRTELAELIREGLAILAENEYRPADVEEYVSEELAKISNLRATHEGRLMILRHCGNLNAAYEWADGKTALGKCRSADDVIDYLSLHALKEDILSGIEWELKKKSAIPGFFNRIPLNPNS